MAPVIKLNKISKFYKLYKSPSDRLKEALTPFNKKYHRQHYALSDIDLEISRGEILGVVGKNGCGKSTLLKLIAGVLVPSSGSVTVHGKISALLELGSGFNPEFTGLQNVFFYGSVLGFSRSDMEKRLDAIIDFAGIGDFINQQLKTYSSGMKARLSFAVAVHVDPEILILDEILSVGDALFKRKCYAKMEEFFDGGKTILFVSHNADSINQLCSRAILIDDGNIVLDDEPKVVTSYYQKMLFSLKPDSKSNKAVVPKTEVSTDMHHEEESEYYNPSLVPISSVNYRNADVDIQDVNIFDNNGSKVNILAFNSVYTFVAEVVFGVDAEKVTFGFEIKDEKGVRLATVESGKMYRAKRFYSVSKGDCYRIEYNFMNLFSTGMYYLNFGVSTFENGQMILNRIVDILAFKAVNNRGLSSGYIDLVHKVTINTGSNTDVIEIIE